MTADHSLIAARALLYGGALVAFGLPAYLLHAPKSACAWLENRRWPWRCVRLSATLGIAATLLHLALIASAMHGVAPGELDRAMFGFVATEMPVGRAALIRVAALAVIVVAALLLHGKMRAAICSVSGGIAVGSLAWNGHAMMHDGYGGWAHLIADQAHLVAAAVWLGALVALLGLSLTTEDTAVQPRREACVAFSFVGTVTVAALILSGVVNSAMILAWSGEGEGAVAKGYVLLLALKILLFVLALALAANNRFRLVPALDAERVQGSAQVRLRRSLLIELSLILGAVLAVAIMGTLAPTT